MAIITFKNNELKETGQTLSLVAVATQMAIEHSYKILIISTDFNERILENCFWTANKTNSILAHNNQVTVGVDSGVEGLIKVLVSNKTSTEIVRNYSKIVLRDRLDILVAPKTENYEDYSDICSNYPEILKIANRYYDLIFVDLSSKMKKELAQDIVNLSDIIVFNITQNINSINQFIDLKETDDFYRKSNVMLLLGRYDSHSKYNVKNITRYMKEKNLVLSIPYNTLYFEACSEGKVVDYFLKLKNISEDDRNHLFINEATRAGSSILFKLQELQMKV